MRAGTSEDRGASESPSRGRARALGSTGLRISDVSIGTGSLGKDVDRGSEPSETSILAGVAMLNGPFPLVDTSNSYAEGRTERVLGLAIERNGGVPADKILGTKADRDLKTGGFTGDRVRRSFAESVERLGVDRFDLYQLHDPYTVTFEEAMSPGGAVAALVELREQGAVGALGIAAGPLSLLEAYLGTGVFDVVLTHNRYTLLNRSADEHIAAWAERGIGVLNSAPFGGGLLARGSGSAATYAYEPAPATVVEFVSRIESLCSDFGVPLPAAALQFAGRHPGVTSVLVGTANPERVLELRRLADTPIPEAFWQSIRELGTPPVDFGED